MIENRIKIVWDGETDTWSNIEMTEEEISAEQVMINLFASQEAERLAAEEALTTLKASARAKLVAGEPLTAEEAETIVI
jgi:hypothetical protein